MSFKIGDRVKIVKKCESYENGWDNTWNVCMDDFVGNTGKVTKKHDKRGYVVRVGCGEYFFPDFVLEKVVTIHKKSSKVKDFYTKGDTRVLRAICEKLHPLKCHDLIRPDGVARCVNHVGSFDLTEESMAELRERLQEVNLDEFVAILKGCAEILEPEETFFAWNKVQREGLVYSIIYLGDNKVTLFCEEEKSTWGSIQEVNNPTAITSEELGDEGIKFTRVK